MTEDPKISQRYRELPREEPPRHLDEAILAASRRASESRPAPLVAPTGRRRWYFPVAAAAIIALAVAVTVHVERQQHDIDVAEAPITTTAAPSREEQPQAQAPARESASKRELFTPDPKPAPSPQKSGPRDDARLADLYKAPLPRQPESPPAAAPPPAVTSVPQAETEVRAKARAEAQIGMREQRAMPATDGVAAAAAQSPEQWLQGIADLRRQGRHDEADRELAQFRKRYPDYRIPEAMLERIEKK